jgi:hypothetical protein
MARECYSENVGKAGNVNAEDAESTEKAEKDNGEACLRQASLPPAGKPSSGRQAFLRQAGSAPTSATTLRCAGRAAGVDLNCGADKMHGHA